LPKSSGRELRLQFLSVPLLPSAGTFRAACAPSRNPPIRIAENFSIFDFELSPDAMEAIDELDQGVRIGPDPEILTSTAFNIKLEN
jgi:hypothetical protein